MVAKADLGQYLQNSFSWGVLVVLEGLLLCFTLVLGKIGSICMAQCFTVEPRYCEPLHDGEVVGITNDILYPGNSKIGSF